MRLSVGSSTTAPTPLIESRLVLVNFSSLMFSAGSRCASAICCLPFDVVSIRRYGFVWPKMRNYPACYIYSFADIINFSSQLAFKPVHPRSIRRFLSAGSPSTKSPHCYTSLYLLRCVHQDTQISADNLIFLPVGTAFDTSSEHLSCQVAIFLPWSCPLFKHVSCQLDEKLDFFIKISLFLFIFVPIFTPWTR